MQIPFSILQEYKIFDPEAALFFPLFDEPAGSKVLEIGSQHSPIASMLAKSGFNVTGIDLRGCDQEPIYKHITSDFCRLPVEFLKENMGSFDSAVTVSAIEHFGLNTYGEGKSRTNYDILAMRYIYDLLKPGGVCYITVPFGGKFVVVNPHWRVYDWSAFVDRLVGDFNIEFFKLGVAENFELNGRRMTAGEPITINDAILNVEGLPCISCVAKLRKL